MTSPHPTAVITGGAGGLGRHIAAALLADGVRVALLDRSADALDDAVAELAAPATELLPIVGDITDETDVERAVGTVVDAWGRIDTVVSNAGIEPAHSLADVTRELWDKVLAVNLTGPMLLAKHTLPVWREQGGGSFLAIGSRTWLSGSGTVAYVASKAALVGLARSIASEYGRDGVRANVIAPAFVRTPLNATKGDAATVEEFARRFAELSPLGRLIEPDDVAATVAFLASPRARNITGEVINVAAGTHLAPILH
jgi:3-oxoacyl-[acyl-carrier protein] reductase